MIKVTITFIYKIIEWRSWRNRYKIWLSSIKKKKKNLFSLSLLLMIDVIMGEWRKLLRSDFQFVPLP